MDYYKLFVDIIGWIASIEIIAAYTLVSLKKLDSQSLLYQVLNLTGGIFLIVNTIYYRAYPSAFVNVVWSIVAIVVIAQMFLKNKK